MQTVLNQQLLDSYKEQITTLIAALVERHVETLTPGKSAQSEPSTIIVDPLPDDIDYSLQQDHSNVFLDVEGNGPDMLANLEAIINGGAVGAVDSEI